MTERLVLMVAQAAKVLGLSPSMEWRMVRSGNPTIDVDGRAIRIPNVAVEHLVDDQVARRREAPTRLN